MNADCLILTAIPKGLDSALQQFRHFKPVATSGTTSPYFATTAPNGLRVVAGMPSGIGSLAAAALAHEAIATFQPKAVLLLGITGGMDYDIPLGDVVVSEQIVDRGLERPALHSGVYLSGNKVIADEQTAGALRSAWRKAAAVEIEASGVASVLWHMDRPPAFLVFKGVCDYADSKKNDDWQAYAADTAASCAFSFVLDHLGPTDVVAPSPRPRAERSSAQLQDRALRESLAGCRTFGSDKS